MTTSANTKTATTNVTAKPVVKQELKEERIRNVDDTAVWTVIGIENCPWTAKAIELLREHKESVKPVILNPEWQRRLIVQYQTKKSPSIFKGAAYFGSYAELENYYKCWFFSEREKF
jgi:hypothetical protein